MNRIYITITQRQGEILVHAFTAGNTNQANLILRDGTPLDTAAARAAACISPGAAFASRTDLDSKTRYIYTAAAAAA